MNPGVALVRAYLHLNGYFTATEFPVIRGRTGGAYQEVTDLDVLAVRFPGATHVISRGRPGPEDDLRFPVDPVLAPSMEAVDVIVAEVKEGKARLNDAVRTHDVLYAAVSRIGCVPDHALDEVVAELQGQGESRRSGRDGTVPVRIRLLAFGEGKSGRRRGYGVVSLKHVAEFVDAHLSRHHQVLNPANLADPVLGLLHLLKKLST